MVVISAALLLKDLSKGTARAARAAVRTITSPRVTMSGVKLRCSNSMMALAVLCIWSMASSIELIRSLMSIRSKGGGVEEGRPPRQRDVAGDGVGLVLQPRQLGGMPGHGLAAVQQQAQLARPGT